MGWYVAMCIISLFGMLLALAFLGMNIYFRKHRFERVLLLFVVNALLSDSFACRRRT